MSDLDKLIDTLNKKKRKFNITLADDPDSPCVVDDWISIGCLALDAIMGGGLPIGRLVELYGDFSTGKSLIAMQAAATAQSLGYIVLYIDTEHALSLEIAEAVGVDISKLVYADPDTIEETFELMEDVLSVKDPEDVMVIIWDSIAATTIELEKEGEYGKATVGRHALLMSQGMRKFNHFISNKNAAALFINQTRQKIGVMFGDDTSTFGGKATEFYASIRVQLRSGKKIRNKKKKTIGITTHAKVVKNKVAYPFKECELPIYFGYGIDDAEAALLYLKELGKIEVRGSYQYINLGGEEQRFQAKTWLPLFDEYYDEIAELILGDEDNDN